MRRILAPIIPLAIPSIGFALLWLLTSAQTYAFAFRVLSMAR